MKTLLLAALYVSQIVSPLQTGTVSGVIRDPSGTPQAGVRVAARPVATDEADVLVGIGQTDETGRYQLSLPAGGYHVVAGSVDKPWFYPGSVNAEDAEVIAVRPGSDSQRVDFIISRVSGIVRDEQGAPQASVSVVAVEESTLGDPRTNPLLVSTVTDAAGAYRLDVFPGRYYVIAGLRVPNVSRSAEAYSQLEPIIVNSLQMIQAYDRVLSAEMVQTVERARDRQLYDQAVALLKSARYSAARLNLELLLQIYPDSAMTPDAKYAVAESHYNEGTPAALVQAAREFNDFLTFFPTSPLAAQAKQRLQEIEKRAPAGEPR